MTKPIVAVPSNAPARAKRLAARRETALRAERVFNKLRAGFEVQAIAQRENCSVRTVRRIIADALKRREIDPPAGYAQLQISRLNEAFMVTYGKMYEGDLKALDCMLKVVQHLDRYHGFGREGGAAPVAAETLALPAAPRQLRLPKPAAQIAYQPAAGVPAQLEPVEEKIGVDINRPAGP